MIEFLLAMTWWEAAIFIVGAIIGLFALAGLFGALCYFGIWMFISMCEWFR